MACSAEDLVVWSDFPKGLRVLLLDEDANSAADTKLKLEAMDYFVFSYCNGTEALEAISKKTESFHVAIVEVTSANSHGIFRFLEMAKDLPTIAISDVHCLSTMMKCIALGAAEFLQKPLSEEKLRNIWQHVVHKAFNAGGNEISKSLQLINEKVVSMFRLQSEPADLKIELPIETETLEKGNESKDDISEDSDRFPAPSTPQLVKGGRSADDGYFQEPHKNCLNDKDNLDNATYLTEVRNSSHSKSKSVDNTTDNLPNVVVSNKEEPIPNHTEDAAEEEVTSDNGSKTDECSSMKDGSQPSSHMQNGENTESSVEDHDKKKSFLRSSSNSHSNKGSRKKIKVDWTPDLHRRFVQVVEQVGIDQAIPSKILELMKVEGLTRHNIASHLQKYRMHKRHILPKDDTRCMPHRYSLPRVYMQKPVIATPPFHSSCGVPPNQVFPFWGHPSYYTPATQMWGSTGFPTWHPSQGSWLWKTHPGIHADVWGCPVVPPYSQFPMASQNTIASNGWDACGAENRVSKDSYDFNLAEEVIDEVVKEAMSKPWLPLPLGLKPPSIDSVIAELQRQGIRTIPPTTRS